METQLKNNGKLYRPMRKLLIGLTLLGIFAIFNIYVGVDGLVDLRNSIKSTLLSYMSENLSIMLSALIVLPISIFMVYAAMSGLYRTFTFHLYHPTFEDNTPGGVVVKGCDSYSNINRVLSYRESKMCGMSSDKAADLYISSSKIESLYTGYNNGPETQRTLSYIESKLCGMSNDRGLDYLANKL